MQLIDPALKFFPIFNNAIGGIRLITSFARAVPLDFLPLQFKT